MIKKHWKLSCVLMIALAMVRLPLVEASSVFPDIQGHYAQQSIQKLSQLGVVSGFPDHRFHPNQSVTRAQFVKLLFSAIHSKQLIEGPIPFQQFEKHWAYPEFVQSYQSGILLDTDWSLYDPGLDRVLTRGEASLLLASSLHIAAEKKIGSFMDIHGLPEKMQDAILALQETGLIHGISEHQFAPFLSLTRGQASILIDHILQFQENQFLERMNLQATATEVKGEVSILVNGVSVPLREGKKIQVGSEIRTGTRSSVTIKTNDDDTLFVDQNTRITLQELSTSLHLNKNESVAIQSFERNGILLRGKATDKNIGLNWETEHESKSFSVYKARNESIPKGSKPTLPSTTKKSWIDTDISPGNTYYYQVTGQNPSGKPLASQEVQFEVKKKASFKEWSGNVVVKVKSLFSKDSKFEIETPTTTAGVRGTLFSVNVNQNGRSHVGVYAGAVGVARNNAPPETGILLHPHEQLTASRLGEIQPPQKIDIAESDTFLHQNLAQLILDQRQKQLDEEKRLQELRDLLEDRLNQALISLSPEQKTSFQKIKKQTIVAEPPTPIAERQRLVQERQSLEALSEHPAIKAEIKRMGHEQVVPKPERPTGGDSSDRGSSEEKPKDPIKQDVNLIGDPLQLQITVIE